MERSTDRILTTHVGSLPRPPELEVILTDPDRGLSRGPAFDELVRTAIDDTVRKQVAAGIDVVSDGEMGKTGFFLYIADRLSGMQIETSMDGVESMLPPDVKEYPETIDRALPGVTQAIKDGRWLELACVFVNDDPVTYVGSEQLASQLEMFRSALENQPVVEAFVPAASFQIAGMLTTEMTHYKTRDELMEALAAAFAQEYRAIVDAGFVLQIDMPEIANRPTNSDIPLEDYRKHVAAYVELLNRALAGIDPERVRVHLCWGNWPGPHHLDGPLTNVLDLVYGISANGISVEAANPRHAHEWKVFEEFPLPEGKFVIPGVIDVCSTHIEHPEAVAQRIVQYANVVGRENVIASTDCGFGTSAGQRNVMPRIAYAKLASLAEGARLATKELWR
jgi:5-methyltetrahydropteroyltriglutamate--homocysteine methyltransferase